MPKTKIFRTHALVILIAISHSFVWATVVQLTESNAKLRLASPRLTFVNFFVDWCPHSQILTPIIEEVAEKLQAEFPDGDQLTIAKVDCQAEPDLAKDHGVMKYPTMKLYRHGQPQRLEYRGQRSVEAISEFIRAQLSDPLIRLSAPLPAEELPLAPNQLAIVGRFADNRSAALDTFVRVADLMREDDCAFIAVFGSKDEPESVVFQKGTDPSTQTSLTYIEESALKRLAQEKCVSIVRELTFENAEAIAEEGLPMFVLFYRDDGADLIDKYKAAVESKLRKYSDRVNFLYGPGALFTRALRHLGASLSDLPLISIDSFQHMYRFPYDVRETLDHFNDRLSTFVDDLLSGKLHTDYHKTKDGDKAAVSMSTEPPVSIFRRLGPSTSRYSFAREEL